MPSPLQRYNEQNTERWTVMLDMPEWILAGVVGWLAAVYFDEYGNARSGVISTIQRKMRLIIENACEVSFDYSSEFKNGVTRAFENRDEKALLLLDITAKYVRDFAPSSMPFGNSNLRDEIVLGALGRLLDDGSKWTIVEKRDEDSGIKERVDSALVDVAEELQIDHLTKAWNLAFQLKPDTEKAVEEAQKAIETAASRSGLTNLTTSVYGGLLADIKTNPTKYLNAANEAYSLNDKLTKSSNNLNELYAHWFAEGMELIQKSHPARHKSTVVDGFKLSPDAAQQTVMSATLLCWLITKKYFYRINK